MLDAFVGGAAVHTFGPKLHVEGDTLAFDGWWKAAFRIAPGTFAVREEATPEPCPVLGELPARLAAHGFQKVPADQTLLLASTYTTIDLGLADWAVWSTDEATAHAALTARAGFDTFFGDEPTVAPREALPSTHDAQRGGARRTGGLAPLVVVAVGIDQAAADAMAEALDTCRVDALPLGQTDPEACCALMPDLAIIDATSDAGMAFVLGLRSTERGATIPIVALASPDAWTPADVTVTRAEGPAGWADHIRRLLP